MAACSKCYFALFFIWDICLLLAAESSPCFLLFINAPVMTASLLQPQPTIVKNSKLCNNSCSWNCSDNTDLNIGETFCNLYMSCVIPTACITGWIKQVDSDAYCFDWKYYFSCNFSSEVIQFSVANFGAGENESILYCKKNFLRASK